ncbi:MAG TPA: hypothetical protein VF691_06120 [Cytophagaceae bacterium]|jgi:hypothetical protein
MDRSYIYGFPFLIYLGKFDMPKTKTFKYQNKTIRLYPPFLGKQYQQSNASQFDPATIPFNSVSKKINNIRFLKNQVDTFNQEIVNVSNCLRVDVLNIGKNEDQHKLVETLISQILSHIRTECNQWEIGSKEFFGGFYIGHFESNERGDQNSEIIYCLPFHTHPRGDILTEAIWSNIVQKIQLNEEPNIVKTLILDSYNFLVNKYYPRMVLSLTWAIEIYRDQIIEIIWTNMGKTEGFKRGKILTGNNLTDHIDFNLKNLCGESFKETNENDFKVISNLWQIRNNVAHGKSPFYFENKDKIEVSEGNAIIFYESTQACINWLFSLSRKNVHT